MKKILTSIFTIIVSSTLTAQQEYGLSKLTSALESQKSEYIGLVNIIISLVMIAGAIYIIPALFSPERENPKKAMTGWIVGLLLWGLINVIF